ncbi:MAG: DUF2007 domain-containing protein [Opitutaceae bacterium]|jgi:hypothetical protein|nr:DUF2007 domain-containing protein [Opitutaceae bacterium]
MAIIAKFNNHIQAGVFKTMLEAEGIPFSLCDSASVSLGINNVAPITIDVPDEYKQRASEIHAEYAKGDPERGRRAEETHPNWKFPFLGVWGMAVLALWLFLLIMTVLRVSEDGFAWARHGKPLLMGVGINFIASIFAGLVFSICCACAHGLFVVIKARFKK